MIRHADITNADLLASIKQNEICLGGNIPMKIYGTLQCKSGKRLKKQNRIFFKCENEAKVNGYRPCGHCMNKKYKIWKSSNNYSLL